MSRHRCKKELDKVFLQASRMRYWNVIKNEFSLGVNQMLNASDP